MTTSFSATVILKDKVKVILLHQHIFNMFSSFYLFVFLLLLLFFGGCWGTTQKVYRYIFVEKGFGASKVKYNIYLKS